MKAIYHPQYEEWLSNYSFDRIEGVGKIRAPQTLEAILSNKYILSKFPYKYNKYKGIIYCSWKEMELFIKNLTPKGVVIRREERALINDFLSKVCR